MELDRMKLLAGLNESAIEPQIEDAEVQAMFDNLDQQVSEFAKLDESSYELDSLKLAVKAIADAKALAKKGEKFSSNWGKDLLQKVKNVKKVDYEVVMDKSGALKVSDELVVTDVDTGSGKIKKKTQEGKLKLKEEFDLLMEKKKLKKHHKRPVHQGWMGGQPLSVHGAGIGVGRFGYGGYGRHDDDDEGSGDSDSGGDSDGGDGGGD